EVQRVRGGEPVDLRDPDGRQQTGDRKEVRVRVRDGRACDEMGEQVQPTEDAGVRERGSRDGRLPGDVDAREPDRGESPDPDEGHELPITTSYGGACSFYPYIVRLWGVR